jgi:hypothetical protein
MKKLIILNYEKGELHTYSVKEQSDDDCYRDLIDKLGHNLKNCEWMIVDNDECIINH